MADSSSPVSVRRDGGAGPSTAAVIGAVAVFLILALWRAHAPTLWNDEVMSISFARRSWYGLLHGAASDRVHPPLFYALLKVWIRVGGEAPLWLRLLPVTTAALAIPAAAALARELRLSRGASAIGLFLVATSGYVVYYGQELRPYALLLLASTFSMAAFARALREETRSAWIFLALVNALLVYSHYFGALVIGTQGLWVLLRARRRIVPFLLSCVAPVLAFVPWAWLVAHELRRGRGLAGNLAGLAVPGSWALPRFYAGLLGPFRAAPGGMQLAAAAMLLLVPAAWLAVRALGGGASRDAARAAAFLAAFALVPPIAAVIVSVFLRPVFHPRYLVEAAVPTLFFAGAALTSVPPAAARAALTSAAAACGVWAAADQLVHPTRIAWGDLVAASAPPRCGAPDPATPVYALGEATPRPVAYYLERARSPRPVVPISSIDQIAAGAGSLAFHSGAELEGVPYWSAAPPDSVRAALEARGLRVLCEQSSGPARREGVLMTFMPAGAP